MKVNMMVQRLVILLLVMVVAFVGSARAEDANEVVVASAKELKDQGKEDYLEERRG